jgi:preprotein translocase subunit YajC
MTLNIIAPLLAMGMPQGGSAQGQQPFFVTIGPLVLMIGIFYLLLIRPQQKRAKEHESLLKTLRPGDKVVTSGGVVGVVITVKEKTVSLRSADTKLEVLKSSVSEISERGGESKTET